MSTHTFEGIVTGMTCGHCAASVREEVAELPGVASPDSVEVVVETGALTVHSTAPLDEAAVRAAVEEAGYVLT